MEDVYEEMYGVPCSMSLYYDLEKVAGDYILPACLKPQQEEGKETPLRRVLRAMKKNPVELSWVAHYLGLLCHDQQVQQELQQIEEEEEKKEAKSKRHDHDQHLLNQGLLCNDQQQEGVKFETMNVKRPIVRIVRKRPEDLLKPGLPCDDRQQEVQVKDAKPENMNVDVVKRPIIKIVKKRPDPDRLKPGLPCNDQQQQVQVKEAKPENMKLDFVKRPTIKIVKRKRQEDDEEVKLEHATEKIRESYQRFAEAKKRKMIQVIEHQNIVQVPKPKPKHMTSLAKKCLGGDRKNANLAKKCLRDRKKF